MDWKLAFLQVVNFVSATIDRIQHAYGKFSNAFDVLWLPSYYVFFKGIPYPHPLQFVQLWASASARPELLFNADTRTFFPATGETFDEIQKEYGTVCLPYLSLEVIDEQDRPHYDLTDFIEKIRFVSVEECAVPNLFHVLAVWSLNSHIVVDPFRFRLRYIDATGDMQTVPIPLVPKGGGDTHSKSLDTIVPAPSSESSEAGEVSPAAAETT